MNIATKNTLWIYVLKDSNLNIAPDIQCGSMQQYIEYTQRNLDLS